MDIESGTVVALRYRIQRQLGRGGMGEVFAAENIRTGRIVAVKLLRADTKQKTSAVARFRREARAAGAIHSDFVTQVLDVEEDAEHGIVIVFELLEGESLIDRLKRTGPMPFDELFPIVEQVWIGLADAHKSGVIHRDLKPSNVFLERRPDGSARVKILDFGISKLPREVGGETLTEMGQSLGTFSFMPPEQIGKAKTVDHRADIYACATLIYQAMSGQLPYAARNILMMVELKAKADPRALSEVMDHPVEPGLEEFLAKCLKRDPNDRFQSVAEALDAWRGLRGGMSSLGPAMGQQGGQTHQQAMSPSTHTPMPHTPMPHTPMPHTPMPASQTPNPGFVQVSQLQQQQQQQLQQQQFQQIQQQQLQQQQQQQQQLQQQQQGQAPGTLAMRRADLPSGRSQPGFVAVNPDQHRGPQSISALPSVADSTSEGSDNVATVAIPLHRVSEALAARAQAQRGPNTLGGPGPQSGLPRLHDDRPNLGTQLMSQPAMGHGQQPRSQATTGSPLQLPPRAMTGTVAMQQQGMSGPPSSGGQGQFANQQQQQQGGSNRPSYENAELATAVYRRDQHTTSQGGLPVVAPPKKKSPLPFILAMIALAAVGFSLVAVIISYVQTGHLPFR